MSDKYFEEVIKATNAKFGNKNLQIIQNILKYRSSI